MSTLFLLLLPLSNGLTLSEPLNWNNLKGPVSASLWFSKTWLILQKPHSKLWVALGGFCVRVGLITNFLPTFFSFLMSPYFHLCSLCNSLKRPDFVRTF
ncbi:hypothetical protein DFJ73DRAFT_858050 [Zopfochytrium polystomum]|nr:hypothetical protein DFJ73DRAFT_858050 [Zopfochytrium polystomum]